MVFRFSPVAVRLSVALALAPVGAMVPLAAHAVEIAPHQAIYEMSLGDIQVGTEVNDVSGRMLFRWSDVCEGWEIEQRYVLEFTYSEGASISISSAYETWEAKDGSAFNFNYQTKNNGQLDENIQGVASLPGGGEAGAARYTSPDAESQILPAETFFPSAHTAELIALAQKGTRFFSAWMFDGTDVQTAVELSAVIGHPIPPDSADGKAEGDAGTLDADAQSVRDALRDVRSWPVHLAFFPVDTQIAEPESEMSMRVYENGIVDELVIDYGDFQIDGRLATLELLTGGGC